MLEFFAQHGLHTVCPAPGQPAVVVPKTSIRAEALAYADFSEPHVDALELVTGLCACLDSIEVPPTSKL